MASIIQNDMKSTDKNVFSNEGKLGIIYKFVNVDKFKAEKIQITSCTWKWSHQEILMIKSGDKTKHGIAFWSFVKHCQIKK